MHCIALYLHYLSFAMHRLVHSYNMWLMNLPLAHHRSSARHAEHLKRRAGSNSGSVSGSYKLFPGTRSSHLQMGILPSNILFTKLTLDKWKTASVLRSKYFCLKACSWGCKFTKIVGGILMVQIFHISATSNVGAWWTYTPASYWLRLLIRLGWCCLLWLEASLQSKSPKTSSRGLSPFCC